MNVSGSGWSVINFSYVKPRELDKVVFLTRSQINWP